MPYEIAVRPERRLGVVRLSGAVSSDVITQAIRELCASEKWMPGYDTLWDLRQMRKLAVSPIEAAEILHQVRHFESHIGGGRTAIVVWDETGYALFSMLILKAHTAPRERKVFYSVNEALRWLKGWEKRSTVLREKLDRVASLFAEA